MCLPGCAPWPPLLSCAEVDACSTGAASTSTGDVTTPTTSVSDGIQTVTGYSTNAEEETGTGTTAGTAGATGEPATPPLIVSLELTPNPIAFNGPLAVTVNAEHASGVRMQLDTGDVIELAVQEPGVFVGEIAVLTGLANGPHTALLTPWQELVDGETVEAPYTIALPDPGSQGFWETGDLIGPGQVAAIDTLPTGEVIEFGTHFANGQSRCYLRRRDKGGVWGPNDLVDVLPDVACTAIDLAVDEQGALFVLADRQGDDGMRWWLAKIPAWGLGAQNVGLGAKGEMAVAVAHHASGTVAVCGTTPTGQFDVVDAMALMFRPNLPGEPWVVDYRPEGQLAHRISERTRDCVFAGDALVLVGEAYGYHGDEKWKRDRLFVLRLDAATKTTAWMVASPGVKLQSGAQAVDVDDLGRLVVAGYTCDDDCQPEGDLRIYDAQDTLTWQASLGSFPNKTSAVHDLTWSAAGYAVVATGGPKFNETAFTVRAFAPSQEEALWTFSRKDLQVLHVALALAIGRHGEVYAGGIGANGYPAVAFIAG
ncbi:MAG: hypothetical protein H0T76_19110 [Nannocystis sp.]|nr:hypothetical protein [Nannocystis sp.]MBA3548599.1 hypothetical protein [Nannocystis sp.]